MDIRKLNAKRREQAHANRKYYLPKSPMTMEERRELNGDKRIKSGFSSTGVPLPSREDIEQIHHEKVERSRRIREKHDGEERKSYGKFFITQDNFSSR